MKKKPIEERQDDTRTRVYLSLPKRFEAIFKELEERTGMQSTEFVRLVFMSNWQKHAESLQKLADGQTLTD